MKIILYVFLIVCVAHLSLALDYDKKYCFQYTWVAPVFNNKPEKYNCSAFKGVPCFEPLIVQDEPPDTNVIWDSEIEPEMCTLVSGNVCLKYTFMYNNDIVNTSLFCGKVIEDQTTAVTSGCYQQNVDGYTIEVCACESRTGRKPCNSTMGIQYSVTLIVTSLILIIMDLIK
ncbi:uncharacterized protein LOC143184389 [Calliopsis andreniformis]|uniref:uncharacterized protein LOC143184389 n=1 Tax=Calliopsis andreniformis TaxID=337506 RepID=UPI003FCC454C